MPIKKFLYHFFRTIRVVFWLVFGGSISFLITLPLWTIVKLIKGHDIVIYLNISIFCMVLSILCLVITDMLILPKLKT